MTTRQPRTERSRRPTSPLPSTRPLCSPRPWWAAYAILVPALGILAIDLVMLRVAFGRVAAYIGVVTGILGIASVVGPVFWSPLGALAILTSILTTLWLLLVGY